MVGSVYSVWGLLGLGGCLFAQIAIYTRGCYCIPSRGALLIRRFQNPEGRHEHSDLPRWAAASVRSVRVCVTGPSLLPRGLGLGASAAMLRSCKSLA